MSNGHYLSGQSRCPGAIHGAPLLGSGPTVGSGVMEHKRWYPLVAGSNPVSPANRKRPLVFTDEALRTLNPEIMPDGEYQPREGLGERVMAIKPLI